MRSCSIPHCVQLLLILTFSTVPAMAPTTVKVKLHQSADLICKQECPGLLKWIMDKQPDDILAHCNQTSCSSKEGYKISHDQYKNGDLSLTIMEADYSKRTIYACECSNEDICHVWLCIEPVMSLVQLKPGEDLILALPIPEPVEVIYNSSDTSGPRHQLICTVVGGSLQCKDEYTPRVSLRYPNLTLAAVNVSDSGVYIVRDRKNNEDIHVYSVSVGDTSLVWDTDIKQTSVWQILMPGLVVFLAGVAVLIIVYLKRTTTLADEFTTEMEPETVLVNGTFILH
ncbi:uncharacterized protein LOC113524101 [Pangasianodon hypophthalmus]|uniref:uncharacterized protein LOC113524101 n=1 Tax=Pangasianodon hypophthalmus TaxID=310915 RepID=UPI002307E05B|nr:uncharacterized protein LOC113524101 [Pangasianodon hypophthalmus]